MYKFREERTCEGWNKRVYQLNRNVDIALLNALKIFGKLYFSDYADFLEGSHPFFYVQSDKGLRISGVVNTDILTFVQEIKKASETDLLDQILTEWIQEKKDL